MDQIKCPGCVGTGQHECWRDAPLPENRHWRKEHGGRGMTQAESRERWKRWAEMAQYMAKPNIARIEGVTTAAVYAGIRKAMS